MGDYRVDPSQLGMPWVDSPFLERLLEVAGLDPSQDAMVRAFARDGFWILEEPVADAALCDRITSDLAGRYTDSATGYESGGRILDGWRWNDPVAGLACAPRILEVLSILYRRRPVPFQTLNFQVGSEQRAHSDTIHFDSVPHGFMCGVWIALEDVDTRSGPLFYLEGSHRLPRFDLHDIGVPTGFRNYRHYEDFVEALVEETGLVRREVHLRRGQAIIWAANLIHGGMPIADRGRTRLSQATHYYFDDCLYYQPMGSDAALGELALKQVVDISTRSPMPNLYRGRRVSALRVRPRKSLAQRADAVRRRWDSLSRRSMGWMTQGPPSP